MQKDIQNYFVDGCLRCPLGATPECKVNTWQAELLELRRIANETELTEEIKWGAPCYTYDGKNVVTVSALKKHATIGFFKGVLLADPNGVLEKLGPNSYADRVMRFTSVERIRELEFAIKALIADAIEVEKSGKKVVYKSVDEFDVPEEFQTKLDEDPALRAAFESLTPGRRKGYLLYFSGAKQSKTRTNRVEKYIPKIMSGKGFHDR